MYLLLVSLARSGNTANCFMQTCVVVSHMWLAKLTTTNAQINEKWLKDPWITASGQHCKLYCWEFMYVLAGGSRQVVLVC